MARGCRFGQLVAVGPHIRYTLVQGERAITEFLPEPCHRRALCLSIALIFEAEYFLSY